MKPTDQKLTDFGFEKVEAHLKKSKVQQVFNSVATRYDLMNDLMSLGLHRIWKKIVVAKLALRPEHSVLDMAGGSGDMSLYMAPYISALGQLVLVDPNACMLKEARRRLIDRGLLDQVILVRAFAESPPFSQIFDRIVCTFGLRNMNDKNLALKHMYDSLKPGGRCIILEFSKPHPSLSNLYKAYTFNFLPKLGAWLAKDDKSYQYLAESIEKHPDQETLLHLMLEAGFEKVEYFNLSAGIVAYHIGYKF